MYDIENVPLFWRMLLASRDWMRTYIQSRNKMAALGYVYTLEKQTSRSPERCTSRNAMSVEFLEVQIPLCVLVYDLNP